MEQVDTQVLNRKLAEWAGFEKHYQGIYPNVLEDWFTPQRCVVSDLPDFTYSLDACDKWLLPRLWICNITLVEAVFWNVEVSIPDLHGPNKHGDGEALDESLPLAICLAIKKMIDGEK